jgi:leucyl-tRNA synthetase
MKQLGIPEGDIPSFTNPRTWVNYFPPQAKEHIHRFGGHIDTDRSFITT